LRAIAASINAGDVETAGEMIQGAMEYYNFGSGSNLMRLLNENGL
jgi:hypothetical protein